MRIGSDDSERVGPPVLQPEDFPNHDVEIGQPVRRGGIAAGEQGDQFITRCKQWQEGIALLLREHRCVALVDLKVGRGEKSACFHARRFVLAPAGVDGCRTEVLHDPGEGQCMLGLLAGC